MNHKYFEVNFVRNGISEMMIGDLILSLEKKYNFNPRQKCDDIGIYLSPFEKNVMNNEFLKQKLMCAIKSKTTFIKMVP